MGSTRNAGRLCWLCTVLSFAGMAVGMLIHIAEVFYLSMALLVVFMIILPLSCGAAPTASRSCPRAGCCISRSAPTAARSCHERRPARAAAARPLL